ncbi:MAG: hypothetical protein WBB01_22755 [Phormidesmis sp.]
MAVRAIDASNFHGYPWLILKLVYRRSNQERIHVRGYKEKGNINTPLKLAINNQTNRFNLVIDVVNRVPKLRLCCGLCKRADEKQNHRVHRLTLTNMVRIKMRL